LANGHRYLERRFARLGAALPIAGLAQTPTPLSRHRLTAEHDERTVVVKHDERSGVLYGGNKVRKLDYILARAQQLGATRVATFGAVGSHHALATALYAKQLGMAATCFLGHQPNAAHVYETLAAHVANGTELIRFGDPRQQEITLPPGGLRRNRTCVVPAGGSSWLGVVGFIEAALEFAAQLEDAGQPLPARLYVANGTMGTVAGLALGLAVAGLPVEVNAVRVTSEDYASRDGVVRLMHKTATLLHRIDRRFPDDLAERVHIRFRDGFVGGGYSRPTPEAERAARIAEEEFGLILETTYTAKAFAALLADEDPVPLAFWNTYSAVPLPSAAGVRLDDTGLPPDFARYFPSGEDSSD